eukprot:3375389-Ditylum_brightwellii.AAC.1
MSTSQILMQNHILLSLGVSVGGPGERQEMYHANWLKIGLINVSSIKLCENNNAPFSCMSNSPMTQGLKSTILCNDHSQMAL